MFIAMANWMVHKCSEMKRCFHELGWNPDQKAGWRTLAREGVGHVLFNINWPWKEVPKRLSQNMPKLWPKKELKQLQGTEVNSCHLQSSHVFFPESQVDDLRYVPQHRLESWGVPLKLPLGPKKGGCTAKATHCPSIILWHTSHKYMIWWKISDWKKLLPIFWQRSKPFWNALGQSDCSSSLPGIEISNPELIFWKPYIRIDEIYDFLAENAAWTTNCLTRLFPRSWKMAVFRPPKEADEGAHSSWAQCVGMFFQVLRCFSTKISFPRFRAGAFFLTCFIFHHFPSIFWDDNFQMDLWKRDRSVN